MARIIAAVLAAVLAANGVAMLLAGPVAHPALAA